MRILKDVPVGNSAGKVSAKVTGRSGQMAGLSDRLEKRYRKAQTVGGFCDLMNVKSSDVDTCDLLNLVCRGGGSLSQLEDFAAVGFN